MFEYLIPILVIEAIILLFLEIKSIIQNRY